MTSKAGKSVVQHNEHRFLHPEVDIKKDLQEIYKKNRIHVGWPKKSVKIFFHLSRPHTGCVVGIALGDEGKGRIIDNNVGELLSTSGIKEVTVIRFQGGSNSGHTVQVKGQTLALHQVPCSVMYKKTTGIMDRGMTINPADLIEEIHIVERLAGSTQGKLFLSQDAVLNTDLDRAEEQLNRIKQGASSGGTGRGIAPSYAHHYDRLGLHVSDLMGKDWKEKLGRQFDRYTREFSLYGLRLKQVQVPDFKKMKQTKKEHTRPVGSRKAYLLRLAKARRELIRRKMVVNTFPMHQKIYQDSAQGVLFEGAQSLGLHAWLGTLPDITASDTSAYGVQSGTAFWKMSDIDERIGIFKIPYTSSVGARRMPTHAQDAWATRVREEAHEYGTTTGRPRDILYPDLPLLSYNIRMSGVEILIGTHLDVSWEDVPIKVATHYVDKKGKVISYQPGLVYQKGVIPHYETLPGWDGVAVRRARSYAALPINARKFLAFLQRRLATPIIAVTTGPGRENYIKTPSF